MGYKTSRCLTGKTREGWAISVGKNIPLYRNSETAHVSRNPAHGRGAYRDRHDAGRTAVGVGHVGAIRFCRAGNRERDRRAYDGCDLAYGKIVWSWRPEPVRQVLW